MQEYFLGNDVAVQTVVTDANGLPTTPNTITVAVTDPNGLAVSASTPANTGPVGAYQSIVSSVAVAGTYSVLWHVTVGTFNATNYSGFIVRPATSIPLVSTTDLGTYLGAPNLDTVRATLVLQNAQLLCESLVSPLPAAAAAVVLDVAARAYTNPQNVQQETTGPFSAAFGAVAGGLWLTQQNKATLRRLSGRGGAFTIDTMPATAGQNLPWWDWSTSSGMGADWDVVP
jgi:hypothetical protein